MAEDIKENAMAGGTPTRLRGLAANGNSISPTLAEVISAMPVATESSKGLMRVKEYNQLNSTIWGGATNVIRVAKTSYNYARLSILLFGLNTLYFISATGNESGGGFSIYAQKIGSNYINLYYAMEPPYISIYIANNSTNMDFFKLEIGNLIYRYHSGTDYNGNFEIVDGLPDNAIKL